jgi:hypothetical protein
MRTSVYVCFVEGKMEVLHVRWLSDTDFSYSLLSDTVWYHRICQDCGVGYRVFCYQDECGRSLLATARRLSFSERETSLDAPC